MKKSLLLIIVLIAITIFPFAVGAVGAENYQQAVLVGKDQVITDNFVRFGDTIDIEGQIEKDVIMFGGNLNIKGEVKGDVLAVASNIKITGLVEGNVRVAGGMVELDGSVGKNVNVFGGVVTIGKNAKIGWNLVLGGGQTEIKGKIGGRIDGWAGQVILASEVGEDVNLRISRDGQLILNPEARVSGNLIYRAPSEATIKEGAVVLGQTVFHPLPAPTEKSWNFSYIFWRIASLFGLLVVGLVLISLLRHLTLVTNTMMVTRPWQSLGWGVVYFIIAPVILVLLAFTVIGLPLALIGAALYFISLYLSKVLVGSVIGLELVWVLDKKKRIKSLLWPMIFGIIIFVVLINIPYIGWIISLLGIWWALGAMSQVVRGLLTEPKPAK